MRASRSCGIASFLGVETWRFVAMALDFSVSRWTRRSLVGIRMWCWPCVQAVMNDAEELFDAFGFKDKFLEKVFAFEEYCVCLIWSKKLVHVNSHMQG
jgi:hypothetical protein